MKTYLLHGYYISTNNRGFYMSRIMLIVFPILFFTLQGVQAQEQSGRVEVSGYNTSLRQEVYQIQAQEQSGRVEVFLAIGAHSILKPHLTNLDIASYLGVHLIYNWSETQSIGIRYGAAQRDNINMNDMFATYRYNGRAGMPTRIYAEVGLGLYLEELEVDSFYGEGYEYEKFAFTTASGVKRFIGQRFSLGLEGRNVIFHDREIVIFNEFSLVLGFLF